MKQKKSHRLFYKNSVFWISRVYLLEILTFSRMCSFLKCTCIPHKRKTFWQLILPSVEIQTFLLIKNWPSFFQEHLNAPSEKKTSWENKRRIWGKSLCNCWNFAEETFAFSEKNNEIPYMRKLFDWKSQRFRQGSFQLLSLTMQNKGKPLNDFIIDYLKRKNIKHGMETYICWLINLACSLLNLCTFDFLKSGRGYIRCVLVVEFH